MKNGSVERLFAVLAPVASLLLALAVGCAHQPYKNAGSWLKRDNAIPQYFTKYDIFFIHRAGFDWELHDSRLTRLYDLMNTYTAKPFGRKARKFAPLLHDDLALDEAKNALGFYLEEFHDDERPFVVMIEGRDSEFRDAFVKNCRGLLDRANGFAILYHTTQDTIRAEQPFRDMVAREVEDVIYERRWHLPHPPEDLTKMLNVDTLTNLPYAVPEGEDRASETESQLRTPVQYHVPTNRRERIRFLKPVEEPVTNAAPPQKISAPPVTSPLPPQKISAPPVTSPLPPSPVSAPPRPQEAKPQEAVKDERLKTKEPGEPGSAVAPHEPLFSEKERKAAPVGTGPAPERVRTLDDLMRVGTPEAQADMEHPLDM